MIYILQDNPVSKCEGRKTLDVAKFVENRNTSPQKFHVEGKFVLEGSALTE